MKKVMSAILFCFVLAASVYTYTLWRDQQALEEQLVRLHVVADSDDPHDQAIKLKVRDAVLQNIQQAMASAGDAREAKAYLQENIPKITKAANDCLKALGCEDSALVTLCKEEFGKRIYDTFSLPAGIYESLRITIGEGEGHNWWCVAYPTLCIPAASRDLETAATAAGLSEPLQGAMTGKYKLRFFLLDLLGKFKCEHLL